MAAPQTVSFTGDAGILESGVPSVPRGLWYRLVTPAETVWYDSDIEDEHGGSHVVEAKRVSRGLPSLRHLGSASR